MDLYDRTIAVVGGDERECEIARLAATTGARVRAYGFPWPEAGITGVERVASASDALEGADYALFPIPGIAADGTLFAPHAPSAIKPDVALLGHMRPAGVIILGQADDGLRAAAAAYRVGSPVAWSIPPAPGRWMVRWRAPRCAGVPAFR